MEAHTVLVVDDDPAIRRLVGLRFGLDGFDVVSAGDSHEALALAIERQPHAIILDVMMPDLDGFEVCRRIRQAAPSRRPVIVMLTAKAGTENMLGGLAAGADDYVVKPPHLDDMVERVRSRLRQAATPSSDLSSLPGGPAIVAELERRGAGGTPVAVTCLDLNGFEAFNAAYGYDRGDAVLEWFAGTLVGESGSGQGFAGRLGSDDFVLITSPDEAEPLAAAVLATFEAGINEFHDPEDIARGGIGKPSGTEARHPLVSLAIGITTSPRHPADYPHELLNTAVQMVRTAKLCSGSRLVVDRT